MKNIISYEKRLGCRESQEVFNYLINTLKETIRGWDYFVDWAKIFKKVGNIELLLNLMNYLIGKENIEDEFKYLLKQYPEVASVIPILIACREKTFTVLDPNGDSIFNYKEYMFKKKKRLSQEEVDNITEFASKAGILYLLKNIKIKNIVDYVTGIEVGLDTNARKNRSGTSMELLLEIFIKKICEKYNFKYIDQATAARIKREFGYDVSVDKSDRRFDFAIDNKKRLHLIEVNYYSGGGSKLKATAGEYKALYDFIKSGNEDHVFIWITDGKGWLTARNPLQETFNHIDYVLNLDMVEKGLLEDILIS